MEENIDISPADFVDEVIFIKKGKYKGRIGYCDEIGETPKKIYLCFGEMLLTWNEIHITIRNVRIATMNDLIERRDSIRNTIMRSKLAPDTFREINLDEEVDLLRELALIDSEIIKRDWLRRFTEVKHGKKYFSRIVAQTKRSCAALTRI